MNRIVKSLAVIAVLGSSTVFAESYPAYGENSYQAIHGTESGSIPGNFYAGLGYTYANANLDIPAYYFGLPYSFDIQGDNINFSLGYEFNRYFAVEARYTTSVTDLDFSVENGYVDQGMSWGGDMSNIGLYLKPQYKSGNVTLYALLGYGHVRIDIDNIGDSSENEFQWGLGMSMDVGHSIVDGTDAFVFLDYVRLYDDEMSQIDFTIDAVTAGIAFKF